MRRFICLLIFIVSTIIGRAQAPDTVLSFQEAKARLLNYNIGLLAAYYDIGIAKAKLIQAKVWNNPNFIVNGDMYNQETNEYFALRNQSLWQLEQVFSIAGKHTNSVKLARIGVEMAEKQMEDVIRSMLFELGNTYSDFAALQSKQVLYQLVISNYDKLMAATRKQLEVGAISTTEAIRVEAEYLNMKADAIENFNQKESVGGNLRSLLRYPEDTIFYVEQRVRLGDEDFDPIYLATQAVESRPDIQAAKINIRYQERNLSLQQSSGVPDVKVGYQPYDRGSNYIRPYHGFTTEIFLPLYDHNQGRIKQAKLSVAQSSLQYSRIENQAKNEVAAAYSRYQNSKAGLANYNSQFIDRLNELNQTANQNFQKRNISLLQFIDQQRIYIRTNIQLIELKRQFLNNVNELNFSVGQTLIDY
ncbi:MAG TPA: TolC family protein [Cyclobacteriaceae bacterium]|nr:TolC family protein [Cyclobacteriaceae bacterium]